MIGKACVGVCLVVSLFVLVVAGCGSDDDSGAGGASAAQQEGSSGVSPVGGSSEEEQVKQVLLDSEKDLAEGDGEGFCARLVRAEQREVAAFGRNSGHGKTCVQTIARASRAGREQGLNEPLAPDSIDVRVDGDRATARIEQNGEVTVKPWELVDAGGVWRVVESGFEPDPLAVDP